MPRSCLEFPCVVEYLSVLDEHGVVDTGVEPDLPGEFLQKLFRGMLLARRFDERMVNLQRQGRIGTFGPIKGQEAAQVGSVSALKLTDWMVPAFREAAAEIWRGKTLESFLLYYGGFEEGAAVAEGLKDLPISISVGTQIPMAVGVAMGAKYRKTDEVVMTFFGDGATSEGDFHEALNFAGVYQLPIVFVCQNNQWAISIPRKRQTNSETIAQKAHAYGIPAMQVDGNDVLAVHTAAREAVERARTGGGPTLIECVTYRLIMHTTADDPTRYRAQEEVDEWMKREPLIRFQKYLTDKGHLTEKSLAAMEDEVKAEIQGAVESAEAFMKTHGDPLEMFNHTYAEMTPTLLEQKAELERALAANGAGEVHHD